MHHLTNTLHVGNIGPDMRYSTNQGVKVQVTYLKRRDRGRIVTQELYTGPVINGFIKD